MRILIATDAAREGLNLQAHCWNLFHFDVPWNPSRMEQRNGRIDRKLQPNDNVYCRYFVYEQRPEDRILKALVNKTDRIKRELGSLSQVIDVRLAQALKQGIRRETINAIENDIVTADLDPKTRATVAAELDAARWPLDDQGQRVDPGEQRRKDLIRQQIDKLRDLVEISRESIGLKDDQFRSAISCALELLDAPPLTPGDATTDDAPDRMIFPALDQRTGADPTWVDTMDSLRAPRKRDQKEWEWRRTSPIRPIVFEDTGSMDDSVVHLHLEHRVVQRLLGRFTAQGFVHHDLSRACLAQTTDAIPRVVLLGRLCLYGQGAARLHEEIVPVAARWANPQDRKGPLTPYAREAEAKTLQLLEEAFGKVRQVNKTVEQQLQTAAPGDIEQLLVHLDARAKEHAADAIAKLQARGEAEAKAMRLILESQQKYLEGMVADAAKKDDRQKRLEFGDDAPEEEFRQLKLNQKHWQDRLAKLPEELVSEPQRIRQTYEVKAQRIEPVGLVYLWPVTG